MAKTGEDCYFFIHGSCRNGDNCQFRHSKSCLLTQDPCKEWFHGKCNALLCPKRHPQLSTTPICKFENSPTGCLNRNCTYRHLKPREETKLPVALAEALKKSVPKANGEKPPPQPINRKPTPIPAPTQPTKNILEQLQPKTFTPSITSNLELKVKPIFKPKQKIVSNIVEKPAPIPIINLRSGAQIEAPSYNMNASSALISNLKVLTTHSEFNTSERHNPTQKRSTSYFKPVEASSHLKSPPSPITFKERPKKLSPITYGSDSKQNSFGIKRTRPLKIGTPVEFSPQEDAHKRLKTKTDSPLFEAPSPVDEAMTSPVLSPLDSTAYFGNSVSGSLGCSISESYNGSQSDDVRIEDQIEDLINENFSPKPTEQELDLADLQDSDDIFLQFEDLIS
eukprot:TRINITY_DN125_c0_g1_i1.p1 TRINITY_DN125_c0_g1~~TRINITY_DN125_c0_g1_i1.p1  ORF type:complete len:394 (+),score=84.49 TRINITY_DN125_c0_g1_i1:227-1408(+)